MPIGDAVNANVACVSPFMCHRDEDEALARGLEGGNFFGYSLAHYYLFGRHEPGRTDVWAEYQARRAEHGYDPDGRRRRRARNGERLGAKVVQGRIVRDPRSDRHPGPAARLPAALRGRAASTS